MIRDAGVPFVVLCLENTTETIRSSPKQAGTAGIGRLALNQITDGLAASTVSLLLWEASRQEAAV